MIDGGLRKIFRERLVDFHWVSVESGSTGFGIPDINYCCAGAEGWIECKATSGWAVSIQPGQVAWHLRRARHGGRTFIAVRRKQTQLWLIRGRDVEVLLGSGLRGCHGPSWEGGPGAWDWASIRALLTSSMTSPK